MSTEEIKAFAQSIARNQKAMIALASSISLAAGAVGGFVTAMKKLEAKYELKYADISEKEISDAKEFYSRHYKTAQFATVEGTVEALKENGSSVALENAAMALLTYQGVVADDPIDTLIDEMDDVSRDDDSGLVEVAKNVFTDAGTIEDFDYEKELENRDPEVPYVITEDEYNQNEFEYDQVEYVFYLQDRVLANERDQVIEQEIVDDANLKRFGYGSNDPNVVYIRNVKLSLDITILRSTGSYAKEVLDVLEHSHKPKIRRFRGDDD